VIGWLKRSFNNVLASGTAAEFARLKVPSLTDETASAVESASYPGHAPELHDALRDQAVAQVRAAEQLPLDPSASLADALKLERIKKQNEDLLQAQDSADTRGREYIAAVNQLASLTRPRSIVLGCLVLVVGIAIAAAVVGVFLGPTIDTYLLHSYWGSVFQTDADAFSATLGFYAASGLIVLLFGLPLALVIWKRGRLHWTAKLGLILVDLGVAAGFGVIRLGDGFAWQAVAVSIIEFAVNLLGTVIVFGVAQALEGDAKDIEPYRKAKADVKAKARLLTQARRIVVESEARLLAQIRPLESREDSVRRADRYATLATATVSAAYAVETSKLLNREAQNPSDDALTDGIGAHLAAEFAREGKR